MERPVVPWPFPEGGPPGAAAAPAAAPAAPRSRPLPFVVRVVLRSAITMVTVVAAPFVLGWLLWLLWNFEFRMPVNQEG